MIQRKHAHLLASLGVAAAALALAGCGRPGDGAAAMARGDAGSSDSSHAAAATNSGVDAVIAASVKAVLAGDSDPSLGRIDVAVSGGKVSLQGSVPNEAAHEHAIALAGAVDGVLGIDDRLSVQSANS
ncbi:MAG: BON domain-containing protein [Burkholderiales bacterium]|nr:BON domain-containing protein [Burkholderiales bacterium]MDE2395746.1 BON domain-containing protein [Burkholderiales bacterium]